MEEIKPCPLCKIAMEHIYGGKIAYHPRTTNCPLDEIRFDISDKFLLNKWNIRVEPTNNHNEFCGIKDGECFVCKEQTFSLGANPSMWPIYLPHIDGQTKHRFYHIKCLYPILEPARLEPHKCTCNRHPDSVFTVTIVNGLSMCPRCGGVCIPARLERLDWKKIEQEFYKECCQTFKGDSGIGGNDPQEWDVQIACGVEDILNFFKSKFGTPVLPTESEIEEIIARSELSMATRDLGGNIKWVIDLSHAIHQAMRGEKC